MTKTTCPAQYRAIVKDFVETLNGTNTQAYVRDVKLANDLRCKQLRTLKNEFLAFSMDELGNAFVVTRSGCIQQFLNGEFKS